MKQNVTGINLLKIISCFMVVSLHSIGNIATSNTYNFINPSNLLYYSSTLAIPIFFMVNGYFTFHKQPSFKYAIRKTSSLIKLLTIWGSIYYFIKNSNYTASDLIASNIMSLMQSGSAPHLWFLASLSIIYLCHPMIKRFIHDENLSHVVAFMFIICTSIDIISLIIKDPIQQYINQPMRMWTWFFYYFAGAWLSKIVFKIRPELVIICIIYIAIYEFYISRNVYSIRLAEYYYDSFMVIFTAFILMLWLKGTNVNMIADKIISKSASMAPGIYLIHPLIIRALFHIGITFQDVRYNFIFAFLSFFISEAFIYVISKIPLIKNMVTL